MNKNSLKKLVLAAMLASLIGCASVGSVANKMVNNKTGGVIYGIAGVDSELSINTVCDAIKNKDPRCVDSEKHDYLVVPIYSKFGYADGAVGINALVKKDYEGIEKLKGSKSAFEKNGVFVKARVVPGQLGEVLEIASIEKDGKCYWSGLPKVGGTVCPAYNYDYRKDYIGVVFR